MTVRAMENWGSITFLDHILYQMPEDKFDKLFRDCRTVAHEISHMWFGNLVTMEWWTDLWLNEGFARFMEFKCLDSIRPLFRPWQKFVTDVLCVALNIDTPVIKSHPVEIDCLDPENVQSFFDSISYLKGASVLRMMEDVMGEAFAQGINVYLNRYKWKNVTSDEFFDCMQEFTEFKIKEIMRTWTQQPGFPLIKCEKVEENVFLIKQTPYDRSQEATWAVPIRYMTQTGETGLLMLDKKSELLKISADWVELNHGARGFYRVEYINCDEILQDVKTLPTEDRYKLIDDSLKLLERESLDCNYFIKLVAGLVPEYEFIVCNLLYTVPKLIKDLNPFVHKTLDNLLRQNSLALWDRFGFDKTTEDPNLPLLQAIYLDFLVRCEGEVKIKEFIVENKKESPYYKTCLAALPYNEESSKLIETDSNFLLEVIEVNNDPVLLTKAVDLFELQLETSMEYFDILTSIIFDRTNRFQGTDHLILAALNKLTSDKESNFLFIFEKILIIYCFDGKHNRAEMAKSFNQAAGKLELEANQEKLVELLKECAEKLVS